MRSCTPGPPLLPLTHPPQAHTCMHEPPQAIHAPVWSDTVPPILLLTSPSWPACLQVFQTPCAGSRTAMRTTPSLVSHAPAACLKRASTRRTARDIGCARSVSGGGAGEEGEGRGRGPKRVRAEGLPLSPSCVNHVWQPGMPPHISAYSHQSLHWPLSIISSQSHELILLDIQPLIGAG